MVSSEITPDLHQSLEVYVQRLAEGGRVVRERVPATNWMTRKLIAGDTVLVELVPQGSGRKILRSVLMLAVIALAYTYGGPLGKVISSKLTETQMFALGTGIIAGIGSLAINLLIPPKPPKPDTEEAAIQSGSIGNRYNPGEAVPVLFGDMRVQPPMAAVPITRGSGQVRTQTVLMCLGYGPLKIDPASIKLGNTPIDKFSGVVQEVREGWDDDAPLELYSNDVDIAPESGNVLNPTDDYTVLTTATNTVSVEVELLFPEGLVYFDAKGKRATRSVAIAYQYKDISSSVWLNPPSENHLIGSSGVQLLGRDGVDERYQVFNPTGEKTFSDRTALPKAVIISLTFPAAGQYEIRLKRTTPYVTDKDKKDSYRDKVQISQLRSIKQSPPVSTTVKGMAFIAVKMPITDQKAGGISNLSVRAQRYVPIYEGDQVTGQWVTPADTKAVSGNLDKHLSSNPAYAFVWAATSNAAKRGIDIDADIDQASILAWRDVCDTLDTRLAPGNFPRFSYDRFFQGGGSRRLRDVLSEIARAGRARVAAPSGLMGVAMDREQAAPKGIFTPRNIAKLSGNITLVPQPHGITVNIVDRDNDYNPGQATAYADGWSRDTATAIEVLDAPGITERWRAWEYAEYYRQNLIRRSETISFTASVDALHNSVGDAVLLKHDVPRPELSAQNPDALEDADEYSGARILEVIRDGAGAVIGLRLDEPVTMKAGSLYSVRIRRADTAAMVTMAAVQTVAGTYDTITFEVPYALNQPEEGDLVVFGRSERVARDVVITDIRPAGELTAQITVVDLANGMHADLRDASLPYFPDYVNDVGNPDVDAPKPLALLVHFEQEVIASGIPEIRIRLSWTPETGGVQPVRFDVFEAIKIGGELDLDSIRFVGSTEGTSLDVSHEYGEGELVTFIVVAVSAEGAKLPRVSSAQLDVIVGNGSTGDRILNENAGSGNLLWMMANTKQGVTYSPTVSTGTSSYLIETINASLIRMEAGDPITFSGTLSAGVTGGFQIRLRLRFIDGSGTQVAVVDSKAVYATGQRVGAFATWPVGAVKVELKVLITNPDGTSLTDTVNITALSLTEGRAVVPWAPPVEPGATVGAILGTNLYDQDGILFKRDQIITSDGQLAFSHFWDFDKADNGWTASGATLTVPSTRAPNAMEVLTVTNDPQLISPTGLNIEGAKWSKVVVRLKRLTAGDSNSWEQAYLYYNTTARSGFDTRYREFANVRFVEGVYATFVFDMSSLSSQSLTTEAERKDWVNNIITQIRIDPSITAGDDFAIDWIGVARVAPAMAEAQSANLVSDLGFKKFQAQDTDADDVFAAKTLDAMNVRAGDQIAAGLDVIALGSRRGRLKLRFVAANDAVVGEKYTPWSGGIGSYQTVKLESLSVPVGTERIQGVLEREDAVVGAVGARFFTVNRGSRLVRYAPVRDDVQEGATDGAIVGGNVTDTNGDPYTPEEVGGSVSMSPAIMYDFQPNDSSFKGFSITGAVSISPGGRGVLLQNTGIDPIMTSPAGLGIDGNLNTLVSVRMRRTVQGDANVKEYPKLYYKHTSGQFFSEGRVLKATRTFVTGQWTEIIFNMDDHSGGWNSGTIYQIRFDPSQQGSGDSFEVDYISIGRPKGVSATSELFDDAEFAKRADWGTITGTGKPVSYATRNMGALADLNSVSESRIDYGAVTDFGSDTDGSSRAILSAAAQEKIIANISGVTGYPDGAKLFASVRLSNNLSTREIAVQIRQNGVGTSTGEKITPVSGNARTFTVTARAKAFSGTRTYELVLRWYGASQDVNYQSPIIEWETAKK